MEKEKKIEEPEYTFDLSTIDQAKISTIHQEGNYLVILTDKGVRFRQHIPQGKMIARVDGKFVLQDMKIQ